VCKVVCSVETFENTPAQVRIHTGEESLSCSRCTMSFTELSELKKHLEIHSAMIPYNSAKKPYICEKPCAKSGSLKTHLRDRTGEKPYGGTNCTKSFAYSSALQKPFSCPSCTESFFSSEGLRFHMRMHNQEKSEAGEESTAEVGLPGVKFFSCPDC